MWIVAMQRPYYPHVEEFDSGDDRDDELNARLAARKLVSEEGAPVGEYESKVYVARVERVETIRTDY